MSNQKYTPEGLPILTRETLNMHFIEEKKLDKETDAGLIKTMEKRAEEIFDENPFIQSALDKFCREYNFKGEDELHVQAAGVYIYQLLKRQAEVNKLEEK